MAHAAKDSDSEEEGFMTLQIKELNFLVMELVIFIWDFMTSFVAPVQSYEKLSKSC